MGSRPVQRVGRRRGAQPRVARGLLVVLDLGDVARRLERSCSDVLGGHAIGSGAHGIKVVRHRDSDRHRRQLTIGHSRRVVRSAGFVKDLGRQIPRAVRVRVIRICPVFRTDVDARPRRVRGPGLAAVEGAAHVKVVAVVAVAPGCPVGRQGVGGHQEIAADKAAVAADVRVHGGAYLAVEHVTRRPVVVDQAIGLVAQVVVRAVTRAAPCWCHSGRRWGRRACRRPARRPPPGRCRRWSG